ncbi:MAG: MBL fold metallo-hydrolase [Alphaproteobacteria bacterium]|nr:MBL fold metallo-hydrolase [Alphaproteobacteria bacterium]MCB9696583.1 MBL fold metallo-hydrolase [Alphaproteobacteria bacterium]
MDLLFHQDIVVATLASGSRGNCTYIGDDRSGVLVDCGLSTRQILTRLDDLGLGGVRIEAVLLTHEHADHVGAARVLDERLRRRQGRPVPFHASRGTRVGLDRRCTPSGLVETVSGQTFRVGSFVVEPFTIPHDTRDPLAYVVERGGVCVGVITDLGRSTRLVEAQVSRLDVAVLEFNHDLEMLLDGPYPWSLKQRVKGPHGHLSNAQAAEVLVAGASSRLKHVVLAHLSDDNNTPQTALLAAEEAVQRAGLSDVTLTVARQGTPIDPIRVRARTHPVAPPRPARLPRPRVPLTKDTGSPQLALFG